MMQIIEQTHDEKVAIYMKSCSKKELAEMLANCNEIIEASSKEHYFWTDSNIRVTSNGTQTI